MLTLAKYLQGVSTDDTSSEWEKGQARPAWHCPLRKNLHGTCEVSVCVLVSFRKLSRQSRLTFGRRRRAPGYIEAPHAHCRTMSWASVRYLWVGPVRCWQSVISVWKWGATGSSKVERRLILRRDVRHIFSHHRRLCLKHDFRIRWRTRGEVERRPRGCFIVRRHSRRSGRYTDWCRRPFASETIKNIG